MRSTVHGGGDDGPLKVLRWLSRAIVVIAVGLGAGCADLSTSKLSPCSDALMVPLSDELLDKLGSLETQTPQCRPAATGEVLINEIVVRPAGRDLDGDGKSTARDEMVELVSLANEEVHLQGVRLVYGGQLRGEVVAAKCMKPYTAALLVGLTTGSFKVPQGAQVARLNKTLRLTDNGAALAIVGVGGQPLDQVAVPLAADATEGAIARSEDGARHAAFVPHALLPHAAGATWSPGTCCDGEPFPGCVSEGVVDREAYTRDARVP